jgi:hypothetical protein
MRGWAIKGRVRTASDQYARGKINRGSMLGVEDCLLRFPRIYRSLNFVYYPSYILFAILIRHEDQSKKPGASIKSIRESNYRIAPY